MRARARMLAVAVVAAGIALVVGPAAASARPARHGPGRHGEARHSEARHSEARHGASRGSRSVARQGRPARTRSSTREHSDARPSFEDGDPADGDPIDGDPFAGDPTSGDSGSSDLVYTAVGDSFSSGEGTGGYYDSTCDRSLNAWPVRLSRALGITDPIDFDLAACSGAVSADIQGNQLLTLDSSTNLVTITAGGNDAAYGPALQACLTAQVTSLSGTCPLAAVTNATASGAAIAASGAWRAALAAAPNAVLLIMGYPNIWSTANTSCLGNGEMNVNVAAAFSASTQLLDAKLATAASILQDDFPDRTIVFVDPNAGGPWSQHTICAAVPWANAFTITHMRGSFHPNGAGNVALCAQAMAAITGGEWQQCSRPPLATPVAACNPGSSVPTVGAGYAPADPTSSGPGATTLPGTYPIGDPQDPCPPADGTGADPTTTTTTSTGPANPCDATPAPDGCPGSTTSSTCDSDPTAAGCAPDVPTSPAADACVSDPTAIGCPSWVPPAAPAPPTTTDPTTGDVGGGGGDVGGGGGDGGGGGCGDGEFYDDAVTRTGTVTSTGTHHSRPAGGGRRRRRRRRATVSRDFLAACE